MWCGDCLEVLPSIEVGSVDAVVTDPPYGVGLKGKRTKWKASHANVGYLNSDDIPQVVETVAIPAVRLCIERFGRVVVTPGVRNAFKYPEPAEFGTIFYPSGAGMGRWGFICSQPIFYYGKCPYTAAMKGSRPNSFSSTETAKPNGHPCPKPVGSMEWLVKRASLDGHVVLDPFAGSGTTGVACVNTGRKFIGIEKERAYFDIAVRRIEAAIKDKSEQLVA